MAELILYGAARCGRTMDLLAALRQRGLEAKLADVQADPACAEALRRLTGDVAKYPLLLVDGKKLRNPSMQTLDVELARAGLLDPGLIHDAKSRRFIRRMRPMDAFVSYTQQGTRMVLTNIEVDISSGAENVGEKLAEEVFELLCESDVDVRVTCPFLRKLAFQRPAWRDRFRVASAR